MKPKILFINALIAVLATVIGGTILDLAISNKPWEKAKLEYSYATTGSFTSNSATLAFTKFKLANTGSKNQEDVAAELEFDTATIDEFSISDRYKHLKPTISVSPDNKKLTVRIEKLFPDESLDIDLLVKSASHESPLVFARSSTGNGAASEQPSQEKGSPIFGEAISTFFKIAFAIGIFAILLRKTSRAATTDQTNTPNNIGFLLMHAGNTEQAASYLEKDLEKAISGSFALANYALLQQIYGNLETAKSYLMAAKFYADTPHAKAVVLFNQALMDAVLGLKDEATETLEQAIKLSPKEITRYCGYSTLMKAYLPNALDRKQPTSSSAALAR